MKRIHLDIKAKFGVVIAVVLASVGLCAWSGLHAIGAVDKHAKTLFARDFDGMKTISELNVQLGHVQDESVQATVTGNKDEAAELQGRSKDINALLAHLKALPNRTAKEQKLIALDTTLWPKFMADWNAGKLAAKDSSAAARADAAGGLDERLSPMKDSMEALAAAANQSAAQGYKKTQQQASSGRFMTWISVLISALLGIGGFPWVVRPIVPPYHPFSAFTNPDGGGRPLSRTRATGSP